MKRDPWTVIWKNVSNQFREELIVQNFDHNFYTLVEASMYEFQFLF